MEIAENPHRTVWVPVDGTGTVYNGSVVRLGFSTPADHGVIYMGPAAGVANTTNNYLPFGIVVGNNNKTQLYDSTYKCNYITAVDSASAQNLRDWWGAEGPMWPKGDPQPMVKVALIDPTTYIKSKIYSAASALTALTKLTVTIGASTTAFTSNASAFTPVAYSGTYYCCSGANQGIYRINTSTNTTAHQVVRAFPNTIAVGDVFKMVNFRIGDTRMQFNTVSTAVDASAAVAIAGDWYDVNVIDMDLSIDGEEWVIFRFNGDNFATMRT